MLKNISILLSVPAATNTRSLLDQMKHLVETLEGLYKDRLAHYKGVLGTATQYIYTIRVSALYERFNILLNMLKIVPETDKEEYTLLVNRYRAARACIHVGYGGTSNTIALLDDFH